MPKIGWQSDLHGKMNLNIGRLVTVLNLLVRRPPNQTWFTTLIALQQCGLCFGNNSPSSVYLSSRFCHITVFFNTSNSLSYFTDLYCKKIIHINQDNFNTIVLFEPTLIWPSRYLLPNFIKYTSTLHYKKAKCLNLFTGS